MTIVYKILGQSNPAADTLTTLYTVPANTSTIVSTLAVCNQAETASTFSIAVRPSGEAIALKHYLNFNTPLPANDTITITLGITLAATDVISVKVGSTTASFSAFGSEIS